MKLYKEISYDTKLEINVSVGDKVRFRISSVPGKTNFGAPQLYDFTM